MLFNPKQPHKHNHPHPESSSLWQKVAAALHLPGYTHSHEQASSQDVLFKHEVGIRTVKQALLILLLTTLLQVLIYVVSNSVALLADTVHNLGDALNSIPLLLAFLLARRTSSKRYSYGYGRAEDLAGLVIVLSIAFSAGYILFEAFSRLLSPKLIEHGWWVILAAIVGFFGNEAVARLQIRVGKKIGSEALVTDGRHARIDGLTSLAIVPAVIGSWLGLPILDPIFGLLIGVAILFIAREAVVAMWYRFMDAIDPHLLDHAHAAIRRSKDVSVIKQLRMRWVGHTLHLVAEIEMNSQVSPANYPAVRQRLLAALKNEVPELEDVTIALYPKVPN